MMNDSKNDLILIGGGGHCRACIDVIENEGKFRIKGIVDAAHRQGEKILGYEIIASDNDLPDLVKQYSNFLVAIGGIQNLSIRQERFEYLKSLGACFPIIISPRAHIAKNVHIGEGTIVMHQAIVNSSARVGKNCILNTMSLLEHDSSIGDHSHISTGSIINGTCAIGSRVFLGSQSVVINDLCLCDDVVVGAGTVVIKNVLQKGVFVGNPAQKV